MTHQPSPFRDGLADPAYHAAAVTPNDSADLTVNARALYIGTAGDVEVITEGGDTVVFANVPVGILPVRVRRVKDGSTTATDIVALW